MWQTRGARMLVQACFSLRLEDSASQTMADAGLANYARKTARYISLLEAKVRALEAAERDMGNDSPLAKYLAEEVENYVAENDAPDMPDLQEIWGPEECAEWDAWQREKAQEAREDEDWDEDAQPPSEHLRMAAAAPALPAPSRPAASAPVALDRINSSTHRKEYMQLATCL